jgi:flagellar biogenesis protein FliO
MGWVLLKTLASLVAVLGLMFGLVIVMKKYLYGFQAAKSSLVSVDVIGQRLIQPKRSVFVVKVLNKILILGITEEGMTSLGEIEDASILHWIDTTIAESDNSSAALLARRKSGQASGGAFADYLVRNIGSLRPKKGRGAAGNVRRDAEEED